MEELPDPRLHISTNAEQLLELLDENIVVDAVKVTGLRVQAM